MDIKEARSFAEQWLVAWNSHDIDAVLSHYSGDFEMTTPMIRVVMGIETGTLKGKTAVGNYWRAALLKMPNLKFSLLDVACGVSSVSVYYASSIGKNVIETFFFDSDGKIFKAIATYN